MVKKLLLAGLVSGSMMGIVGCGGGSDDDLPTPSGKLTQDSATELLEVIEMTGLSPYDMLMLSGGGSSSKMAKMISSEGDELSYPAENTYSCGEDGNVTYKLLSGDLPYYGVEVDDKYYYSDQNSSSYDLVETYVNCGLLLETGVKKYTASWKKDAHSYSESWSATRDSGYSLSNGEDKFVYSAYSASGEYASQWNDGEDWNNTNTRTIKFSGTLTTEGEEIEFSKIKRYKSYEEQNYITLKKEWSLEGAVQKDDYDGWIVVTTPEIFKMDAEHEGCYYQGKLTISGKEHTLTKEVVADNMIEIKYDGELIETKSSCL